MTNALVDTRASLHWFTDSHEYLTLHTYQTLGEWKINWKLEDNQQILKMSGDMHGTAQGDFSKMLIDLSIKFTPMEPTMFAEDFLNAWDLKISGDAP